MAEGGGLLNRYRVLKPYRGFESHPLRQLLVYRGKISVFRVTSSAGKPADFAQLPPAVRVACSHPASERVIGSVPFLIV